MINLKEIKYIWIGLGLLSILFHIYLIFSGLVPSLISRPLHMALAIPWVFIFISQASQRSRILNLWIWVAYSARFDGSEFSHPNPRYGPLRVLQFALFKRFRREALRCKDCNKWLAVMDSDNESYQSASKFYYPKDRKKEEMSTF